ncbi:MAG TPA: DUF2490 domain-containing protein, partial [Cytophagales bacterium]|nr:DUF2490 domain-containing protein [Cytophagales bacterium]
WLGLGLGYRYSGRKNTEGYFENRNRFNVDLELKRKFFGMLVLQPRVRYQRQYTALQTSEMGMVPRDFLRYKLVASLDLDRKYEPYLSAELYYQMQYDEKEFNRVRYEIGTHYKFNKHHRITLFFLHQRAFNEPDPMRQYITGLAYKYTF